MESDCLALVFKLRRREILNNFLDFASLTLLNYVQDLILLPLFMSRGGGNLVAHALARFQPYVYQERLWIGEILDTHG